MVNQGGRFGAVVWALSLFGCGAGAPDPSSEGASDDEGVGSISLSLDATCSVKVFGNQSFDSTSGGYIVVTGDAQCADFSPLEYRLTALDPKSKTLLLQDWNYSKSSPLFTLAPSAPQGTYTLVAEARRVGTTAVVAKGTLKTVLGSACVNGTLFTLPSGQAPLDSTVHVNPLFSCAGDVQHEWRLSVTKPGGGSVSYPWQAGSEYLWSTTGLNAGTATLSVSVRNVGNTVVDATLKSSLVLGPVCNAASLGVTGSGSARTLAATATCFNDGVAIYRYSVTAPDGTTSELRAFAPNPSFDWNVAGLDGAYTVKVEVRDEQAPAAVATAKTLKVNLGSPCTKLTLAELWGQHLVSQPLVATATAACSNAEYQFQRRTPGVATWTTVCAYSSSSTCDLNQQAAPVGDYVVRALVRKQGSIAAYDAASSQREYVATDGRPLLRPLAVPSSGNAVALSADGRWVAGQTFRWSRSTGYALLDRPDDAPSNIQPGGATDINDAGSIIIGWDRSTRDEPFRWSGNVAQWLFPTQIFYEAHANATSASGSVIVGFHHQGSDQQAFRYTSAGGLQLLGDLPGGYVGSDARDVSGDGNVVVGNGRASDHDECFRWTAATGMTTIGLLPGDSRCNVNRVSRNGSVIIGQGFGADAHAVRWTAASGLERLSDPSGTAISSAQALTADGSTIFGFAGPVLGEPVHAAMWTQAEGGRYLSDVLSAQGVDLTGWDLAGVVDVSSDGKTVLGSGSAPGAGLTGWLLTLP